jgi:hypothetical protein
MTLLANSGNFQSGLPTASEAEEPEWGIRRAAIGFHCFSRLEDGGIKGLSPTRTSSAINFKHPFFWAPFILIGNSP